MLYTSYIIIPLLQFPSDKIQTVATAKPKENIQRIKMNILKET